MTTSLAQRFADSQPQGISNVSRDANGALVAWVENGCALSVARGAGFVVLTLQIGNARAVETFYYSADGFLLRSLGDYIPTGLRGEVLQYGVTGRPVNRTVQTLGNSAVQVACVTTGSDEGLWQITVPAMTFGPNDQLQIEPYWRFTNNANNKIIFVKTAGGIDLFRRTRTAAAAEAPLILVANRNAMNSQTYPYQGASGGNASHYVSSTQTDQLTTIDFSVAQTLIVGGQRANSGDSLTLENVRVMLIPGAR